MAQLVEEKAFDLVCMPQAALQCESNGIKISFPINLSVPIYTSLPLSPGKTLFESR